MKEDDPVNRKQLWILLSAIFLTPFSLIAFEITLSRLLSVLLSYHYVFLVLSLALLGLGVGGMFVHFFRPQIPIAEDRFAVLAFFTSLFSLAIPFSIIIILQVSYIDNIQMNILLYGFLFLIPFFWAGVLLAEIYRIFPTMSAKIYGADLIGAAAGSFAIILFLNLLGGISSKESTGKAGGFGLCANPMGIAPPQGAFQYSKPSCSAWRSFSSCFCTYCLMMRSLTLIVLTKYPLDQNLLPQYFFRVSGTSLNIPIATRPLIVRLSLRSLHILVEWKGQDEHDHPIRALLLFLPLSIR